MEASGSIWREGILVTGLYCFLLLGTCCDCKIACVFFYIQMGNPIHHCIYRACGNLSTQYLPLVSFGYTKDLWDLSGSFTFRYAEVYFGSHQSSPCIRELTTTSYCHDSSTIQPLFQCHHQLNQPFNHQTNHLQKMMESPIKLWVNPSNLSKCPPNESRFFRTNHPLY